MYLFDNLVVFDGVCNLCNGLVQFLIKKDRAKKFTFTSLQNEVGQMILKKERMKIDNFDSFVYIRKGKLLQKSTAGLFVIADLGGLFKLILILWIIPYFIRDWIYMRISKNRYSIFGKSESCMIPTAELKNRFI